MYVCDYCKKEIDNDKVVHLRFNSYWIKELGWVSKDFCNLECLKKWLEKK